ncbi:very-long-chain (3R)-3-hydroxyacyl-CoA dehydratase 1 isoform X3 [Genypterus blacodes]|uniref:very-long-chain (3R)-3-hydroxyacyl-CoA dehydratase 1 isoform X3 n=1 Tax=Genypterus blacodes TaxID=154954 RepID=UPI003F7738BE
MASSEEDGAVEEKENNNKKKTKSTLATAWLTFYNIAMTAGWLVLALTMMRFYIQKGTHKGLYRSIARTLKFFQTFALVEVGHCAIAGIVRTSVIVTGVQVCSRIFMVWFVTNSIRQIQNEESVILFLVVWTVTEITRYSYYTFNLLHHLPYFIKWASVSSALLPHAAAEEEGASRRGHSGEGRLDGRHLMLLFEPASLHITLKLPYPRFTFVSSQASSAITSFIARDGEGHR